MFSATNDNDNVGVGPIDAAEVLYRIASTREEQAAAFRLVYNSYLRAGLGEMNAHRMRVTPYHLLPSTEVFIAEHRGKVAFTMSLIADGELGLPMDSVYGDEVDQFRLKGLRLGEVSCLADCQRHVREFFPIFLCTCRLMAQYARYRGLDALVAAVHPKHSRFYRRYMDFHLFGCEKTYPTVRNNPAVAAWLEFARLDREIPPTYKFFFGEKIPFDNLQPQPITWEDCKYFQPMIDHTFQCVAAGRHVRLRPAGRAGFAALRRLMNHSNNRVAPMAYRTEESDVLVVNLSRWEGKQLSALLEHSIAEADQESDLCSLIAAMESLSEADALARWKRQNIDLELRPEEAAALLRAVKFGNACCAKCAAAAKELSTLPAKLKASLESRRVSADNLPTAPFSRSLPTVAFWNPPWEHNRRLSKDEFGVLWCGRLGCTLQARRLHHKLFLGHPRKTVSSRESRFIVAETAVPPRVGAHRGLGALAR